MNEEIKLRYYFAAANGYTGFRCSFDQIFSPGKYERLYVLKGGPGTGKSSLMKNLAAHFNSKNCEIEKIYCSSDKSSLDGVIIMAGERSFAVIDGTAPHERDASLPGARDEIINLGDFWDKDALIRKRKEIETLAHEKKLAYTKAYDFLSLAGNFDAKMRSALTKALRLDLVASRFDFMKTKDIISSRNRKSVYLSSFGKDGYYRMPTEIEDINKRISVIGKYSSDLIVLTHLSGFIYPDVTLASPFCEELCEGLIKKGILVYSNIDADEVIYSEELFSESRINEYRGELEYWQSQKDELLLKSQKEFIRASQAHFALEKIYSAAMDFSKIDGIYEKTVREIEKFITK